jgi:hypothetical protein
MDENKTILLLNLARSLDAINKEIENDLMGSFSIKNGNPPKCRFQNLKI